MTVGIYKLSFIGTDKVYIGQSQNCEVRYRGHKKALKSGKVSPKLKEAYLKFGLPIMTILTECTIPELDSLEISAISVYDAYHNGFNSTLGADYSSRGEEAGNALHSLDEYIEVFMYLVDGKLSMQDISSITGVSVRIISHISSLESHIYLKDMYPEEYLKLQDMYSSGVRRSASLTNCKYKEIISPAGVRYTVEHCTNFAKEHGLSQPKLSEVLCGKRNSYKGWHTDDYKQQECIKLVDPLGIEHTIQKGNIKKFCREYSLHYGSIHNVTTKKYTQYLGWALA